MNNLIINSIKPINEIVFKLDDLKSRSKNCLFAKIDQPDDELMFAIILKSFSDRQIQVDKKLIEGLSEDEIYEYFKNKYGEWIVYEPEIGLNTILLWVIPLILFIFGGILIVRKVSIK